MVAYRVPSDQEWLYEPLSNPALVCWNPRSPDAVEILPIVI
jgi:hypothetical protein